MPCYGPLTGYRSKTVGASGKRALVFDRRQGFSDLEVTVPCGRCIGCRLEHARQWAVRCMHEASLHQDNAYITLTYNDENLPKHGSLDKTAFPKFMKRLRKAIAPRRVRYFHSGEYGDDGSRPHYHALLFGWDWPDKTVWRQDKGIVAWRSAMLEKLWTLGNSETSAVTFESAAYVARYVVKKLTGEPATEKYERLDQYGELHQVEPEYGTMSRNPGIAKPWLDRYLSDVYPADHVIARGVPAKPPRYYDQVLEQLDPEGSRAIRRARERARKPEEETPERLAVREVVTFAKLNLTTRRFER